MSLEDVVHIRLLGSIWPERLSADVLRLSSLHVYEAGAHTSVQGHVDAFQLHKYRRHHAYNRNMKIYARLYGKVECFQSSFPRRYLDQVREMGKLHAGPF